MLTSDLHPSYVILLRSFRCKWGVMLQSLLFSQHTLSPLAFSFLSTYSDPTCLFFCPCHFFVISSDFNLHRSVLSHRLCSSFYSLLPLCSLDVSLQLGHTLLGLCTLLLFYINHCTTCTASLTLTYLIIPRIYVPRSLLLASGFLLVLIILLS